MKNVNESFKVRNIIMKSQDYKVKHKIRLSSRKKATKSLMAKIKTGRSAYIERSDKYEKMNRVYHK